MIRYTPRDWLPLLLSSRGSLSPGVFARVLTFGLIALGAYLLGRVGVRPHPPLAATEIGGAALALVLAFRINTAYIRFWEGRTLWGAIVNATRNLDRTVARHAALAAAEARAFATWIVLFAHATRRKLRNESLREEAERLLGPEEAARVLAAPHPALVVASELSARIAALRAQGRLDPILTARAEEELSKLVDSLGGCEKIRKTPPPLGLLLLLERFCAIYLLTLPFALVPTAGAWTPLITMIGAYPVLMIDALGAELDDPFGHDSNDLPLTRICRTIESDLLEGPPSRNGAPAFALED